ncbi:HAD-IIB family hydrolase [Kushneria phosphatilytica]|uniref:HAD-IIB family hydrolase n=1 Tax=Kushneria phosphatilytica TaxID=657387 RepID=A0A1S1NW12_9GAMM|nr:HAD-IIB family hydrolase [Kushneria phosphatilytica]OHV09509.1 mannosyl-3-phosphoglycerate phosphatase [Kushneria phosphatilytica]QEL11791.1 HAD-IIB family hydrolase [Kushneria phosphatilytica]
MFSLAQPLLIFTDLDGSLLDHDTYDHSPAIEWLARLKAADVPVILNTSKTAAEVLPLYHELGLDAPFVTENGGCVYLPESWVINEDVDVDGWARVVLGASRSRILTVLEAIRETESLRFRGFADMTHQEVMTLTGLDEPSARRACQREASEPLIWRDSETALDHFRLELIGAGLELTRGGRFHHVMGETCSKGRACGWLISRLEQRLGTSVSSIALGDGPNDVSMFDTVDAAVIIRGKHDQPIEVRDEARTYRTHEHGPHGWVEGLEHWISAS